MPRNPNKTRCYHPSCNAWAMRGHTLCRAHRDSELGSRGAGAPANNLNALKTGLQAHPLPPPDLNMLAEKLIHDDEFPLAIGLAAHSIHQRTVDPVLRALGLLRLLEQLVPLVSNKLLKIEVNNLLFHIPPEKRANAAKILKKHGANLSPVEQLDYIRTIYKKQHSNKELPKSVLEELLSKTSNEGKNDDPGN